MHAPYTDHPADVFQAAQIATGALLTLIGYRPLVERGRLLFLGWATATWLTVLAPALTVMFAGLGAATPQLHNVLWLSTGLLALVLLLLARRALLLVAPFAILLGVASQLLTDFDWELCAAHLFLSGLALALVVAPWRRVPLTRSATRDFPVSNALLAGSSRAEYGQDLLFVVLGSAAAALVAHYVLFRHGDGSDETAYTYQAAVYAKGQLYGKTPPCMSALRNHWLFWRGDRMFAQYQPGWPLFLVPFVWIKAIWLGGPASFGLLCMAMARLARRAVKMLPWTQPGAALRAGFVAGSATLIANSLLVNGGSRFPHVFLAALFALTVETSWMLGRTSERRRAIVLGLKLGSLAGWMLLVRVPDTVLLSVGPLLYLAIASIRRRSHWLGLVAGLAAMVPWGAFLFWSAHKQVGGWGVLPYQLTTEFYSWAVVLFSIPKAHLWKWSIPIGTGAYCWWPLSPALGIAGLVLACRERTSRAIPFTLVLSGIPILLFYGLIELGRGDDFGYGPRYTLVLVVPIAVGVALLVERTLGSLQTSLRRAMYAGFGVIAAATFCLLGKDLFPSAYHLLHIVSGPERAAAELDHAIVLVPPGVTPYGPFDVTRNVPIELYDPPVIYANESDTTCLRREFPDRRIYRASGRAPVKLTPVDP